MPSSRPVSLRIPAIHVSTGLTTLGTNPDGSAQVPTSYSTAGWYRGSVTPGELGPAIILGHVDSHAGPGVFFRLGQLRPGDHVSILRADGTTARFRITGVREYRKAAFPTITVYGNTSYPALRLITCGGQFDRGTGHYVSNIVAFGQLEDAGA